MSRVAADLPSRLTVQSNNKSDQLSETASAYARGLVGALIVGMPTLMTMEMWWGGFTIARWRLLLLHVVNFGVLLALQHYSGLHPRKTPMGQLRASLVALGIGIIVGGAILLLIGVLRHDTVFSEAVGKIALQAVSVSIGASIGSSHFDSHSDEIEQRREHATLLPSVGMGVAGALVFGFNAAVTEEPMVIGEQLTWMHAIGIVLVSLVLVFAISYAVGKQRLKAEPLSRPWFGFYVRESVATYAAALLIAAYILWTFGRIDAETALAPAVHMTIALGLVTTLGATAGELLI